MGGNKHSLTRLFDFFPSFWCVPRCEASLSHCFTCFESPRVTGGVRFRIYVVAVWQWLSFSYIFVCYCSGLLIILTKVLISSLQQWKDFTVFTSKKDLVFCFAELHLLKKKLGWSLNYNGKLMVWDPLKPHTQQKRTDNGSNVGTEPGTQALSKSCFLQFNTLQRNGLFSQASSTFLVFTHMFFFTFCPSCKIGIWQDFTSLGVFLAASCIFDLFIILPHSHHLKLFNQRTVC